MGRGLESGRVELHEAIERPRRRTPHAPLLTAPSEGHITVIVLSERFEVYANHWVQSSKRIAWCPQSPACEHCQAGWANRVSYYAAVRAAGDGKLYTLAIPQSAWDWCPQLEELQGSQRGMVWRLTRLRTSKQGPVRITCQGNRRASAELPSAWCVRDSVARAFGLATSEEGA